MTLAQVAKRQKVTIVSLNTAESTANRLHSLGIIPGAKVRVVDNSLKDAAVVECFGSRLALGRGIAQFIAVK